MRKFINQREEKVIKDKYISAEDALTLLNLEGADIFEFFGAANRIRQHFKGNKINLCSIINAKSGRCPQNCTFCAQSIHYQTAISEYPLLDTEKILSGADQAIAQGSQKFGIVTSGKGIEDTNELNTICETIRQIKEKKNIHRCASLGVLTPEIAETLKQAGLEEYHHNLESSESFYNKVCTTRSYRENEETIRIARKAGFRTCSGGIFGIGETPEQRIELAFALKELDVHTIPLNFLHPVKGTPLENASPLKPLDILKIIAIFRFILPDKDIKVAGGREKNLRDLQSMIFFAGANSTMVGNYLTTKGRNYTEDLQMIEDLGLEIISYQ